MKHLITLVMSAVCMANAAFATLYQASDANGTWNNDVGVSWGAAPANTFPSHSTDEAFFPGPTAARTMTIPATNNVGWQGAVTAAVVTIVGNATNRWTVQGDPSSGKNNLLVMTNDNGNALIQQCAGGTTYNIFGGGGAFSALRVQALGPLDIVSSNQAIRFYANLEGNAPVRVMTAPGGSFTAVEFRWANGVGSQNYTGTIQVYGSGLGCYSGALQNATLELQEGASTIAGGAAGNEFGNDSKIRAVGNSRIYVAMSGLGLGRTFAYTKSVTIVNCILTNYINNISTISFRGAVRGNGKMKTQNGVAGSLVCSNQFVGSIEPGIAVGSVGKLTSERSNTNDMWYNYFGIAEDKLNVVIDVTGAGGVAGTDHDQLEILNQYPPVDLANIDLYITNTQPETLTNYFLTCDAGYSGAFNSSNVFKGQASDYCFVFEPTQIGVVFVPEPALIGVLALALMSFTKAILIARTN